AFTRVGADIFAIFAGELDARALIAGFKYPASPAVPVVVPRLLLWLGFVLARDDVTSLSFWQVHPGRDGEWFVRIDFGNVRQSDESFFAEMQRLSSCLHARTQLHGCRQSNGLYLAFPQE